MTWTVTIPMAIPSGNEIKRALYHRNRGYYKRIRSDFGLLLRGLSKHIPQATGPRQVTITRLIPKRGKSYDHDNFVAGAKPLMDELVASGLLIGDAPGQVAVTYQQEKGEKVGTVVALEDWLGVVKRP